MTTPPPAFEDQRRIKAMETELALDSKLREIYHQTVADVAKESIERSRDSAKYVQVAATAIQGVYVGVLGLTFVAGTKSLPIRGLYPALFLAAAVALSVFFLGFISKPSDGDPYPGGTTRTDQQLSRTFHLVTWTRAAATRRSWSLRAAVVALGVGIALMPLPFITPTEAVAQSVVEAPAIPERIPTQISEKASDVFNAQADAYLASLNAIKSTAEPCEGFLRSGPLSVFWACAWDDSEGEVNRAALWLAAWGAVLVVAVPFLARNQRDQINQDEERPNQGE